jgi:dTDP-4-dehydrorhamnose reductase
MKKKVLIFGPNGQLGSDLCRVFKKNWEVFSVSHAEADVTREPEVINAVTKILPDVVINATAYNKVEQAEVEVSEAFALNAFACYYMAKVTAKIAAKFVHISTDYVFDGTKSSFDETDRPCPLNVYGLSKLTGERLVKYASPQFYIVRTSTLFGLKRATQKTNFIDRMAELAAKGETLKVVDNLIMSPTYSADLAEKIKQLIEKPAPFGIYHITNSGSCSWHELAKKTLELLHVKADLRAIKFTEEKIKRPKFSVLQDTKLTNAGMAAMPPWQDALQRYLKEKYSN